jgi:RimJ/RimL family protein N-acetyltransferase
LLAEAESGLVGYIRAEGGAYERNLHNAVLVIGIQQEYVGMGIGTRLMNAVEEWAREADIHRLELTVMRHNAAAIGLYQKMGFAIEGTRIGALKVDGEYIDEYYMARILDA